MLRLVHLFYLLVLLATLSLAQSTTCKCNLTYVQNRRTSTTTLSNSSLCTRYRIRPTCSAVPAAPTPSTLRSVVVTPTPSAQPSPGPVVTPRPSTPTPAPTPTPSACVPQAVKNNGKRGAAYNATPLTNLFSQTCQAGASKVSWAYNWFSAKATDGQASTYNNALSFVPMLWSAHPDLTSVWVTNVNAAIASGTKEVLGFNEPDGCGGGGACMSMADSVKGWRDWMQPLAGRVRLGSPAVTNGDSATMGLAWLRTFYQQCTNCRVDFTVIHWYGDASQAAAFKTHVANAYEAGGRRPIWITEFGCSSGGNENEKAFMRDVFRWLDGISYVERYAYFFAQEGFMITGGKLNDKGLIFDQY